MQFKRIYLLDTCAWVNYYKAEHKVKVLLDHIIEQRGLKKATLFMPSFCIVEVFNTFAKWRYRRKDIKEQDYEDIKKKFRDHVRKGALISEYPLHIYHIYNTDYIVPFENQWDLGHNQENHLSSFDILIIGMGMELVKHYGDKPVKILTCEKRIANLCNYLRSSVNESIRKQYNIPAEVEFPKVLYLPECEKKDLPFV